MEQSKYVQIIRLTAILSIIISTVVIIGWVFHIEILKSVISARVTMKFNTALCFLLIGCSLYLITKGKKYSSGILSSMVLILAVITFSEYVFSYKGGIDELFIKDVASSIAGQSFPGRMAPTSSLCLILMAFSLLNLRSESQLIKVSTQYILHLVSFISFIAILGYPYDVPGFYKIFFPFSMAVHTAFLFFLLSISLTLLNPSTSLIKLLTGNEIGNIVARRIFPLGALVIIVLGFAQLQLIRLNIVSVQFGIALFTAVFVMVSLLIISNAVRHLNKIDSKRHKAEYSLKMLNMTLEQKVKERTEELDKSEEKFYKIFETSPAGLIVLDISTGVFLEVNQSFVDLTGYTRQEVIDKTAAELGLVSLKERKEIRDLLKARGYIKNHEADYYTKSGEKRYSLMSVELIEVGGKEIALTVLSDITEIKLVAHELKAAKEIAEESALAKERFMSNMSHEIRTPMNAIIGFTNLIEKTKLNDEQEQYLNFIKTSGENLLIIINDILDYSKIEAGMMQIEKVPFKIGHLLQSIEIMFSGKAKEKKLTLIKEIHKDVPDILIGDPTRLSQILINLAGNAIKFTKKGSVKITISLISTKDDHIQLGISVKDTGIGIPEDKQKTIFERFMQASNETSRNYGGTGLGLSIVKRLVELQHGEITIKSNEEDGTEFYIVLPYLIGEEELLDGGEPAREKVQIRKFEKEVKVLLAEDNIMNQMLAKKVLLQFGCSVDIAENGGIAVEMARMRDYDLILMDVQMPIMDGYEASKMIRNDLHLTVPIIAMTAHVMAGEKEKCISLGMSDYISKPFKVETLYSLISKYINA